MGIFAVRSKIYDYYDFMRRKSTDAWPITKQHHVFEWRSQRLIWMHRQCRKARESKRNLETLTFIQHQNACLLSRYTNKMAFHSNKPYNSPFNQFSSYSFSTCSLIKKNTETKTPIASNIKKTAISRIFLLRHLPLLVQKKRFSNTCHFFLKNDSALYSIFLLINTAMSDINNIFPKTRGSCIQYTPKNSSIPSKRATRCPHTTLIVIAVKKAAQCISSRQTEWIKPRPLTAY